MTKNSGQWLTSALQHAGGSESPRVLVRPDLWMVGPQTFFSVIWGLGLKDLPFQQPSQGLLGLLVWDRTLRTTEQYRNLLSPVTRVQGWII